MAARKVNTPGATEKAPEPVSTAEQAEAALERITGNDPEPEAPQDQSTNETSSLGAPEKAPEPVSTAEQAEAALERITGNDPEPEAPQDQSTNETSSLGAPVEPTAEELAAKKEYEEFLQWRKNKGEAAQPATQHAPTSNASTDPTAKRTRQVVGPNGWITEEY